MTPSRNGGYVSNAFFYSKKMKTAHCSKKRSKKVWWIFLADLNVDCFTRSRRIWTNPVSFGAVFHAV